MDIHEYQAKELLAGFGVSIPRGGVALGLCCAVAWQRSQAQSPKEKSS